jgi:hypothetical protein
MQTKDYCVYLTHYLGDKLPPYYIGSTSVKRLESGYTGSVLSKKYKSIYKKEKLEHPELFLTYIIHLSYTRLEAIEAELEIQKFNNAVKSDLYFNMAYANKGWGMDVSGENNPCFGRVLSEQEKYNSKIRNTRVKLPRSTCIWCGVDASLNQLKAHHNDKCKLNPNYVYIEKPKRIHDIVTCPHCGISGGEPAMMGWHFDRCSMNPEKIDRKDTKYKKIQCPHCSIFVGINVATRNHFDNCKHNPNYIPVINPIKSIKPRVRKMGICPHCGTTGVLSDIKRYHFDKCRHKRT